MRADASYLEDAPKEAALLDEERARCQKALSMIPREDEFLLKKEDYEKFTSIDQLAFDPGKTYLSIDNQNYIYGNEKFNKYASQNELLQAYMAEAKKQDEPKRWNNSAYKNGMNSDERKINRIKNNPLRGNIVPGENKDIEAS